MAMQNITIFNKTITHWKTWEDQGITEIGNISQQQMQLNNYIVRLDRDVIVVANIVRRTSKA